MPKNVMKMMKPRPNPGRNDFDLSHRTLFTANYGELIPGACIETVPDDKIIIRISDLVRAQPMVTSPYVRAKQHCDVWFVPYQLMWSKFNEFVIDKDEPGSSALKNRQFIPHTNLYSLETVLNAYHGGTYKDVHGYGCTDQVARNLDLLGYAGTMLHAGTQGDVQFYDRSVNMWRLLAYNLIWYREYRQQYYDDGKYLLPSSLSSLVNGAAYLFNADWKDCSSLATAKYDSSDSNDLALLAAMCQPRYRTWKKDLFTGLMPSTQFGAVSLVDSSISSDNNLWSNGSAIYIRDDNMLIGGNPKSLTGSLLPSGAGREILTHTHTSQFDILALRKSEAIQKWRERSLRAGNQVQDNFEAHYGVKPKSHMDIHPQHIASFDAPLNIGDIMSNADTGVGVNGVVGDVAGKGIMSFDGRQAIKFEASDFGVIMVIYSVLPEAEYNANGIDRLNCLLEREDYFFNEYENLGLEAVDKTNISHLGLNQGVLGYAPRYFGYKQKLDRVTGRFQMYQGYSGQFAPWCAPKFDVDDAINLSAVIPLSCLYVNPAIFNNNFHYEYDVVDQFLVDFYCDVEAIRAMSVSGMPGY